MKKTAKSKIKTKSKKLNIKVLLVLMLFFASLGIYFLRGTFAAGVRAQNVVIDKQKCTSKYGNERILCNAEQMIGIRYANNNAGGTDWAAVYAPIKIGTVGHDPVEFLDRRVIGGNYDFLDCSGLIVSVIKLSFNVTSNRCSAGFYANDSLFKKIGNIIENPMTPFSLVPGDIIIKNSVCGNSGHIGVFEKYTREGNKIYMHTIEAASGGTGYVRRIKYDSVAYGNSFCCASKYIGPGSEVPSK